jgi:hypothetical protein
MNIKAIAGNYVISKGFAFARYINEDKEYFEEFGDMDNFVVNIDVSRDERKDNRFGVARTADSQVTEINATFSATLTQHNNRNRALALMGSNGVLTQASDNAAVFEIVDASAEKMYWLGRFDISAVVVTDGATVDPVTYVVGTDYVFDAKSGAFQPLKDFPTLKVTFTAAAIQETQKRLKTGIAGNPDIEAEIIYIGNATKGGRPFLHIWNARITPSGGRGYIGTERTMFEIEGTLQIDTAKALAMGDVDEYAYGYETTLAA